MRVVQVACVCVSVLAIKTRVHRYVSSLSCVTRFSIYEADGSCCLMTSETAPSGSFFIRFQASILDMDVTSQPLTDMIWSPTRSVPVLLAAPPENHEMIVSTLAVDTSTRKRYQWISFLLLAGDRRAESPCHPPGWNPIRRHLWPRLFVWVVRDSSPLLLLLFVFQKVNSTRERRSAS